MAKAIKRCEYTGVTLELSSGETALLFALLRDTDVSIELTNVRAVLRDIIGGSGKVASEYN